MKPGLSSDDLASMDLSARSERLVVGVMTGTSIDGIDAALVRLEGRGLQMRAGLITHISESLGDLQQALREAAQQKPMTAEQFTSLAWDFGLLHARIIAQLHAPSIDLICVHGQTVFHRPPLSWQLLNPAPIAQRFKCPVVSDLRQADLAAGGQGAPLTPLADWIMFRDSHISRAIVNLGGFCNVTVVPAAEAAGTSDIQGFDLCPCNQVLDAVARAALGKPIDVDGTAALSGMADPEAVNTLLAWIKRRRDAPAQQSMGTGDEAAEWVNHHRGRVGPQDLAASAVNAIGSFIATAVSASHVAEVIVAGGGTRNQALMKSIASISKAPVRTSDELGVPAQAREAMAFAILGGLCADRVPVTLPQITGCPEPSPLSGVWHAPALQQPR